jgi:hypothetical protein
MSRTASSNGPGIGRIPNATRPRSGLGMRPSRARTLTARIRRRATESTAEAYAASLKRPGLPSLHPSHRRAALRVRSLFSGPTPFAIPLQQPSRNRRQAEDERTTHTMASDGTSAKPRMATATNAAPPQAIARRSSASCGPPVITRTRRRESVPIGRPRALHPRRARTIAPRSPSAQPPK